MTEFKFQLGDHVIDTITGFQGIVNGCLLRSYGINYEIISTTLKDGNPNEVWFMEDRLKIVPEIKTGFSV
jgi:hypothetical protein